MHKQSILFTEVTSLTSKTFFQWDDYDLGNSQKLIRGCRLFIQEKHFHYEKYL